MNDMINPTEVRKALNILKPNGELFEIRILAKPKKTLSGYFTNIDLAIDELEKQNLLAEEKAAALPAETPAE